MWNKARQTAYEVLIARFKQRTLLQYFEMDAQTFLFTDAHKTGLGAMLAQGDSIENAKPMAIASRTTNTSEQKYPQIDLEALAIDFVLRRFRHYIVGSPTKIQVITDHQPLCSIFNGKRQGSIRTERIKLRHQDIRFTVTYQRGKINQSDYLSRHAKPIEKLTTLAKFPQISPIACGDHMIKTKQNGDCLRAVPISLFININAA